MLFLAIGGLALLAFLGGLRAFERASIGSIKLFFVWVVALAGLSLALILVLTGRAGGALAAATLLAPLAWEKFRGSAAGAAFRAHAAAAGASAAAAVGWRHVTGGGVRDPRRRPWRQRG